MSTTVLARAAVRSVSPWSAPRVVAAVLGWITIVLAVDTHAGIGVQRGLGVVTWVVLVLLLAREAPLVRVQTLLVVVFASIVEYTFSPLLGVYLYRFDNVPAYVPPGHGLVYLAALAIGRSAYVRARTRGLSALVLVVGGCWALYGVTLADRPDALGAFWFVCLAAFLRWGPSQGLYVGAFLVVSYLEILGTSLGTWAWQPRDPTGLVSVGNPPSGAAGGYGWFDLFAVLLAPAVLTRLRPVTRRLRRDRPPGAAGES